jgi:diadenylate cyclase
VLAVAIPIIFQPELRRALERLGRSSGGLFSQATPEEVQVYISDQVCKASKKLSERRHGALIVLQRGSSLQAYVNTGVVIDSQVTVDLLLTVFWPKTELHDGAVIIDSKGRMAAAASVLPLSASRNLPDQKMGTRHRASLGISEISDALCVVVSEESGKIAITNGGRMVSRLEPERLRTILNAMYGPEHRERETMRTRIQHRATQFLRRGNQPTKAQQSKL